MSMYLDQLLLSIYFKHATPHPSGVVILTNLIIKLRLI